MVAAAGLLASVGLRQRGENRPLGGSLQRARGDHTTPERVAAAPAGGGPHVTLVHDRGRQWLAFSFPFDEALNAQIKRLPGRRFDWDDRRWLVPADRWLGSVVLEVFARHRWLVLSEDVRNWVDTFAGWHGIVTATEVKGEPVFVVMTFGGTPPAALVEHSEDDDDGTLLLPMTDDSVRLVEDVDGADFDDLAERCAVYVMNGEAPPAATLELATDDKGEKEFELHALWGIRVRERFGRLSEARASRLRGEELHVIDDAEVLAVPADPALAPELDSFLRASDDVLVDDAAREQLDALLAEHAEREETVALSHAEDAELEVESLGGELRPFQRAGVAYALRQRRTFIADEQGLGKTVQALAALELDGAYPAVVVCPASIKLNWEREAHIWLPHRRVAVVSGRTLDADSRKAVERADVVILNYEILEWHLETLAEREPRAAVFDESHYAKQPRARRTKAALALSREVADDGLRLALTGTPVMNRPKELVSQLRLIGRLADFGSGARLSRRFGSAGSHERLHWNLRAHCYVRRLKSEVLPQLPEKSHETVVVEIDNEEEYRLAERDVVAWLRSQPLDLRELQAKVSAALRAERLARLNYLRQLAGRGKLAAAIAWIDDFLQSGEPLVVFADHVELQRALLERFPFAAHVLGSDSSPERDAAVADFQRPDGPPLIVCSLKAASHGITLTRASNVAFLELDWTPARLEQAEDRTHRIGQRDAVTAWYLLAPATIDSTLEGVLEAKRGLIGAITDGRVEEDRTVLDSVIRKLRGESDEILPEVA
jgi:SWI/SNF-related matrix-associated actin-dependent regulator of chromatin subfamily A-like protein 1